MTRLLGITYQLQGAKWRLTFSPAAIEVLKSNVQRGSFSKESVGQLYSKDLTATNIEICHVTKLRPLLAGFTRVKFEPRVAMAERHAMLARGLHCVGLWHTHPEPVPTPSLEDRILAKDHAVAAKPNLAGLVFAIVGHAQFPRGLKVWIHDGEALYETNTKS